MTAKTRAKLSHGGRRPGAGRKPVAPGDRLYSRTVSLPTAHWDYLERLGDGNLSAGIRRLIHRLESFPDPDV